MDNPYLLLVNSYNIHIVIVRNKQPNMKTLSKLAIYFKKSDLTLL